MYQKSVSCVFNFFLVKCVAKSVGIVELRRRSDKLPELRHINYFCVHFHNWNRSNSINTHPNHKCIYQSNQLLLHLITSDQGPLSQLQSAAGDYPFPHQMSRLHAIRNSSSIYIDDLISASNNLAVRGGCILCFDNFLRRYVISLLYWRYRHKI